MSRFLRLLFFGASFALVASSTRASYADSPNGDPTTSSEKRDFGQVAITDAEPPPDGLPKKRAIPDFDGRGKKPATTEDALLWIPRILLAPLYLATEYGIRRPLGAVISAIERDKLTQRIIYIFTVGPKRNFGFSPTFYYDNNQKAAIGAYVWWDDVGSAANHVRGYFATWGEPLILATIADRYDLSAKSAVSMRATFNHREDTLYYGVGPETTNRTESRYSSSHFEAGPELDFGFLSTKAGVRHVIFGDDACCDSPRVVDLVREGKLPTPPRYFDHDYTTLYDSATITLDSRRKRGDTGALLTLNGAPSFDVSEKPGAAWLRYEASGSLFWDVTGTARVLSLSGTTMFVDPLQGGPRAIPFTELIALGGTGPMRGFSQNRLLDRSAAVATLGYEWPIWAFVNGTMQAALGNVFGAGLKGFDVDKLRFSGTLGLRSNSSPDHQFEILTGFGTETFEQGGRATSFRLAFGATRGF